MLPVIGVLIALFVLYKYVDPAPPEKIVISTGKEEGNYHAFALIYREFLKKDGITLELRQSEGGLENLRRLQNPDSGVDLAFVQDGLASTEATGGLVSLGSIYYEPVWIFCRCKSEITHLSGLKGKKIAIGEEGGGTRVLALTLLNSSGVNQQNASLLSIGDLNAANAIQRGDVDAAFFVDVPNSALIQKIALDRSLRLVSLDQAEAYARQFPYLHHLVLPEGALSLERNIPAQDVHLVSSTSTLVARQSLHPALTYLMLKIISKIHSGPGLFQKANEFPAAKDTDIVLSGEAQQFYKSGLPFLDRYLPFWVATFINRMFIVAVPLVALLYPLTKEVPGIYSWLIKSKLLKYYGQLRFLETQVNENAESRNYDKYLGELNAIEDKVNQLRLPIMFSQHLYELRGHIELVRSKLMRLKGNS